MKKLISFTALYIGLVASACSPKTNTAIAATPVATSTDVSNAQVDAAKTKYPDATIDALKQGHDVYYGGACTRCHGAKKITNFSEDELPGIIENMARKAKISAEEKDAVLKYVMGVKLASAK
ncbi:MAG TPA: hypothetical protein VK835_14260 [Bacteroidia bacterium]|jgi:hypothetical protein|nr:hypothetical protein [Bacteroidia bacterium]